MAKRSATITRFSPDAKGWVVRRSFQLPKGVHQQWWCGPDDGQWLTAGALDAVAVFATKTDAERAYRTLYGRQRGRVTVERVAEAVAFAIEQARNTRGRVLAGNHPRKAEIAQENLDVIAYLQGERTRPWRLSRTPKAATCPTCGSPNIEENDPRPGEHTCRDCGEWIDE